MQHRSTFGSFIAEQPAAAAMIAAQASAAIVLLAALARSLAHPYALDYGEPVVLDIARRLSAGENVYRSALTSPPFVVTNYPPLFFAVQAPFVWVFGGAYWYGRLISTIGALAAALCAGLTVWNLTRNRIAAVAACGALVSAPVFGAWAQRDRVDTLALALGLAALAALTNGRPRIGLASALLVAAGFTRQTSWIAPALAGWMFLRAASRNRDARTLVVTVAMGGALLAAALEWATGGGFARHVILWQRDPFDWLAFRRMLAQTAIDTLPLGVLAIAAIPAVIPRRREPWAALAAAYLAPACAVAALAGKAGGYTNYFLEAAAALAIIGGLCVWLAPRPIVRAAAAALIALQAVAGARAYGRQMASTVAAADEAAVLAEMRRTTGAVVSNRYLGLIPISGHDVLIEPYKLGVMAADGRWDEAPFVRRLAGGEAGLIVVFRDAYGDEDDYFTPGMRDAISRAYRPCREIAAGDGTAIVMRPRCW